MAGRTIQDVIDSKDTITAWCHNPACGHRQTLDFIALRERLGPDHGAMHDDLVPKMRCTKCRGKKAGITINQESNKKYCAAPSTWGMLPPR